MPSPRDPWLFALNRAASRCRRCLCPLFGPPATRSRRGAGFRGVHAAHPAVMYTSARFFYANQSHKIKRLNFVHCYFGADVSVCTESGFNRPASGACDASCRRSHYLLRTKLSRYSQKYDNQTREGRMLPLVLRTAYAVPSVTKGAGYNPLLTPCMSGNLWAMPLWQSIQV